MFGRGAGGLAAKVWGRAHFLKAASASSSPGVAAIGSAAGGRASTWYLGAAAGAAGVAAVACSLSQQSRHGKTRCETDPVQLSTKISALLGSAAVLGGSGAASESIEAEVRAIFESQAEAAAKQKIFETYWPRKIMMVFGAPGAGKGTQGPKIVDMLGIPQLSTGDMLREAVAAGTEVGKKAKEIMASGGLVSDDIVIGIIADRIKEPDCKTGFILDGFPRTIAQTKALDAMLAESGEAVSLVLAFEVDPGVLEERICGRWMDKKSGRSYHVKFAPPKSMQLGSDGKPIAESMKDDVTGAALYQRPDDTAEALKKRLDGYNRQTVPILDHYRPKGIVRQVDGGREIMEVWDEVKAKLAKKP